MSVMAARLLGVTLERFKSYYEPTSVELAPLTVVIGRNNSGKSSILQALLLLKQTLAHPRREVPLHFEGLVDALHLRELTSGWPAPAKHVNGPTLAIQWQADVDVERARAITRQPSADELSRHTGLTWLDDGGESKRTVIVTMRLQTSETTAAGAHIHRIELMARDGDTTFRASMGLTGRSGEMWYRWDGNSAEPFRSRDSVEAVSVELHHFIPHLTVDRSAIGPRSAQRAYYNAFVFLFEQPLEQLEAILHDLRFLGSTRSIPPTLYKPASTPPEDLGVSGEYAAQLIHARQRDVVHFLPPLSVEDSRVEVPERVEAAPLVESVNAVMQALGVETSLQVATIQDVGFRLLFGQANLAHVGRGLTYLLPIVELGLIADPLRFQGEAESLHLDDYARQCDRVTPIAFEEPEAHLHPRVQSRLAHWFVALAMAQRQVIVETHSDHLVRRLRGLMARAGTGSALERWLRDNVVVLEVDQDAAGHTRVVTTRLTPEGGLGEHWPAEFMDESSNEDSNIYYASLDKQSAAESAGFQIIHDEGPEPEPEAEHDG